MTKVRNYRFIPSVVALGKVSKMLILLLLPVCFLHHAVAAAPIVYEVERVDQAPSLKKPVRFRIPYALRRHSNEITLRFVVNSDGKVEGIVVVKVSDPDLIEPVYSAYEKAVYSPGLKNGVPVNTWVTVTEKTG